MTQRGWRELRERRVLALSHHFFPPLSCQQKDEWSERKTDKKGLLPICEEQAGLLTHVQTFQPSSVICGRAGSGAVFLRHFMAARLSVSPVCQLSSGEDDHGALPSQQGAGHGPPGVL